MVARIWRGYTVPENADAYERFLKEEFMYSNKGLDMTKSIQELEEDFM